MPRVPPVTTATRFIATSSLLAPQDTSTPKRSPRRLAPREAFVLRLSSKRARETYSTTLDAHGDTHATADAERRKSLFDLPPLHLVQQGHEHARAGSPDRVPEGDRAAIHVDLGRVEIELL